MNEHFENERNNIFTIEKKLTKWDVDKRLTKEMERAIPTCIALIAIHVYLSDL